MWRRAGTASSAPHAETLGRPSVEFTREYLARSGVPPHDVTLVTGWCADTCTPETRARPGLRKAGAIVLDCDLCSSTREVLAVCEPLIDRQAAVVFDDRHTGGLADRQMGEARAFGELLVADP